MSMPSVFLVFQVSLTTSNFAPTLVCFVFLKFCQMAKGKKSKSSKKNPTVEPPAQGPPATDQAKVPEDVKSKKEKVSLFSLNKM